jgi:hypothetical protein
MTTCLRSDTYRANRVDRIRRRGLAGCGLAGCGLAGCGLAGYGLAGYGLAGYGLAGYGPAGYGPAGCGPAGCGLAGYGPALTLMSYLQALGIGPEPSWLRGTNRLQQRIEQS